MALNIKYFLLALLCGGNIQILKTEHRGVCSTQQKGFYARFKTLHLHTPERKMKISVWMRGHAYVIKFIWLARFLMSDDKI